KTDKQQKKGKIPKFIFECQECHECCSRDFQIYYHDLERWARDQTLSRVLPHLELVMNNTTLEIRFRKTEKGVCPFLIEDQCMLSYSKPISCESVPLGYNGTNYIITFKNCKGRNKGGPLNKEQLKEIRDRAKRDYECRILTASTLPIIQMLMIQFIQKQNEELMKNLSPEDRQKLEEILKEKENVKQ
ncbi:MAG: hypothetical protein ACXQS8_07995, partial [Candidatus Helarchaeales archaeon]